ncbi:MAG: aspartate aminotransferase family protein [Pseudomonadota bacterium]
MQTSQMPNMNAHWMPFSAMRDFRENPRMLVGAEGHYYRSEDGRQLYDSFSGLWTCGVGHCHPKIVAAVQKQVAEMDYAIGFQVSHTKAFELADRLLKLAPDSFGSVLFTNSGSESADTALKVALAYHRANGHAERTRFVGRARGYHGTNFGGMSVGGITPNRKAFSAALIPGVDHLPHTFDLEHAAFSRGQPRWGAHLANELERICAIHGGENIAAVIVEPAAGSTGILPPPVGYLQRLRDICTRHGMLLIFDEVITAFGRVGSAFASHRFGVTPDIITTAKGLTNGVIPMGGVLVSDEIHTALMEGAGPGIELFHGYTYSGHPVAAAAGLATLDVYAEEGSFDQARSLEPLFEDLLHGFADHPKVIDVRNIGLMGAIELESRKDEPGARGLDIHKHCFWEEDLVMRNGGDTLQFSPFLNSDPDEMIQTFEKIRRAIDAVD